MNRIGTLIVGGGISGLGCAHALHSGGDEDFILVSDHLGGRMLTTADGLNLGAAYVTSHYRHVLAFADRGPVIRMKDTYFWDGDGFSTVFHPRNLLRSGEFARLYRIVIAFHRRLDLLRRRTPRVCQKTLLAQDPVLSAYVRQPAADLVAQHRLEDLTEVFCGPLFHSTLFVPWEESNAFYYLANLAVAFLPTHTVDLTRTVERLSVGYPERIVRAKVTRIEEIDGGNAYRVFTEDGQFEAGNVVLAVPGRNAAELMHTEEHARNVSFCVLHVRGRRRREFVPGKTVFLRESHRLRVLWPQDNGTDITYCAEPDPDLSTYYHEGYEIARVVNWKTAIQISGDRWRALQPRPNLFTIGDHNIVGLEDSYLTGLFAANTILGRS